MARKSSKSPAETMALLQKRMEAVATQAAKEVAAENPVVQGIMEYRNSVSKDINELSRNLKGPQSFENRRKGFQLRIEAINAGETLAKAQDEHLRNTRVYLDEQIANLAKRVANGETLSAEDSDKVFAGGPTANFNTLVDAEQFAKDVLKSFNASRTGSNEDATAGA